MEGPFVGAIEGPFVGAPVGLAVGMEEGDSVAIGGSGNGAKFVFPETVNGNGGSISSFGWLQKRLGSDRVKEKSSGELVSIKM